MKVIEQAKRSSAKMSEAEEGALLSAGFENVELRSHCAYNQTRECFLGLDVKAVDLPPVRLGEFIAANPLKSGEGIWMIPFNGIQAIGMPAPLDLIYLDEERRVIDMVESYPTFQVSSFSPRPNSALALPAHSIYTSQTQLGDRLVLCIAEEMERQLQELTGAHADRVEAPFIAGAVVLREKPLWSGGPGLLELETRAGQENRDSKQRHMMDLTDPGSNKIRQLRGWLGRWWSPDPRKAPRVKEPGLAAYYWNGSAPDAKAVRDISTSGLYVVTEERWYPGTLILMTLQRTSSGEELAERSIAVHSRAVRWGPDGVGLQFVLTGDEKDPERGKVTILDAASKADVERFLEQLKQGR
jgi:uncharacterized protein